MIKGLIEMENEKMTITVKELSQIMRISIPKAYELANTEKFPCINVGRRKIIPFESFKHWMERQAGCV